MESNTYCTSCKAFKASSEFISYGAKGVSKQLKTCDNCRQRFRKSDKKRNDMWKRMIVNLVLWILLIFYNV